jgi:hypothetical protein
MFVRFLAYLPISPLELDARKRISGITGVKALERLRKFTERATRPRFLPTTEDVDLLSRFSRTRWQSSARRLEIAAKAFAREVVRCPHIDSHDRKCPMNPESSWFPVIQMRESPFIS